MNNLFIILNLKNLILIKAFLLKFWSNAFLYEFILLNFMRFSLVNKILNKNYKSVFFFRLIMLNLNINKIYGSNLFL